MTSNTELRTFLTVGAAVVLALLALDSCTGDAPTPHDEPPEPQGVRSFKEYKLGGDHLSSYVVETADGQRVTCFVLAWTREGTPRGFSCVPHLR